MTKQLISGLILLSLIPVVFFIANRTKQFPYENFSF